MLDKNVSVLMYLKMVFKLYNDLQIFGLLIHNLIWVKSLLKEDFTDVVMSFMTTH